MPVQTVERVKQREGALRRKVREAGAAAREKLRALKKRLRRAQRKRRRLERPAKPKSAKPAS